ncbi:hypothetical protein [Paludibacterium yongneupense]|uniref:hypothetical protein n=1 Tax=Paludibacterium yongneupense TaxID=400061 RepID=UPI0003FEE5D4|nr:hypothetical protein [Paludibacterium yongneupense]
MADERENAWLAPVPGIDRPGRDPLPDPSRFATLLRRCRRTIDGRMSLGAAPLAAADSSFVYHPGADCISDVECYQRVRLLIPEGCAVQRGTLTGPAVVLVFACATGGIEFIRPLDLPSGLEVVHGSVVMADSPTTPVATQGGTGQSLRLADRGRLAALDLGSRFSIVHAKAAGSGRVAIAGDLIVRANGAWAPSLGIALADGKVRAADLIAVGGRAELDPGALLMLSVEHGYPAVPVDGLPLLKARLHGGCTLKVHPCPERYVTFWRADTLYLCERS